MQCPPQCRYQEKCNSFPLPFQKGSFLIPSSTPSYLLQLLIAQNSGSRHLWNCVNRRWKVKVFEEMSVIISVSPYSSGLKIRSCCSPGLKNFNGFPLALECDTTPYHGPHGLHDWPPATC